MITPATPLEECRQRGEADGETDARAAVHAIATTGDTDGFVQYCHLRIAELARRAAEMADRGVSPEQVEAYCTASHETFDSAFHKLAAEQMASAEAEVGGPPLPLKRPANDP